MFQSVKITNFSAFCILAYIILMLAAWFELAFIDRTSYFSDSEYYFNAYYSTETCTNFNGMGFVCYARFFATILDYTEFIGLHTLFYILLLLLVARTIRTIHPKLAKVIILSFSHPFVLFVFVRGLKEMLLILTVILTALLIIHGGYITKKLSMFPFLFTFVVTRPLGLALVVLSLISSRFMPRLIVTALLAFIAANLPVRFIPVYGQYLAEHAMLFVESGFSSGSFLAPVRFLIGPTPIKPFMAFFDSSIYTYGTLVTLIILFIGSFYSLYIFLLLFRYAKEIPVNFVYASNIFFVIAFVTLIIYSMIYGGSVDTRHRAFFFVTLASGILLRIKGK